MAKQSFYDKEARCEFCFREAVEKLGPLWHYCTPGHLNLSVNITEEDLNFSVNNLAISAAEVGVTVVTDSHMSNHLHSLLACRKEQCFALEEAYLYRMGKRHRAQGRVVDLSHFRCEDPIPVTSLASARNEIVYIHRNRYVVDPRFTPFSDPWSGGSVYFNLRPDDAGSIAFNHLPYRTRRAICMRSTPMAPDTYRFRDGKILQSSYLAYRVGESFFRDAQHYFSHLTKNVEAYSEVAKRLGDRIVLTEEEIYQTINRIAERDFNIKQAVLLPPRAKIDIARTMHFEYNATNSQIQRMLKLDPAIVQELFPA